MDRVVERRFAPLGDVELRAEGGMLRFAGNAAVFDQMADIGPFREKVGRGAFNRSINNGADVALLYNHHPDSVMARTTSGTLRLKEADAGLATEADLDLEDADVKRIRPKMERGDLRQMSFAFQTVRDDWDDTPEDGGKPIRTLKEVRLFDVSIVTFPAYEGTDAALLSVGRSAAAIAELRGLPVEAPEEIAQEYAEEIGLAEERDSDPEGDPDAPEERVEDPQDDGDPPREEHALAERRALLAQRIEYLETLIQ